MDLSDCESSKKRRITKETVEDDLFVWPWVAVVANIPTKFSKGRYIGESGSKLRDELTEEGFHPVKVSTLWDRVGHSGKALVECRIDWSGFVDLVAFDETYLTMNKGNKVWKTEGAKEGLYGWAARAEDYNSPTIVGDRLRKFGNLRTLSQIMEEERSKSFKLRTSRLTEERRKESVCQATIEANLRIANLTNEHMVQKQLFYASALHEQKLLHEKHNLAVEIAILRHRAITFVATGEDDKVKENQEKLVAVLRRAQELKLTFED